jgi:uncharacterized protein (DUF952 family)
VKRLFHITTREEATAARRGGTYTPEAFAREGFIHCSYAQQVVATADRLFGGRRDLVLLEIDRDAVPSRIVDENLEGGHEAYPHIYGPLPMAAVRAVHDFRCADDGTFALPTAVRMSSTA